MIGDEDKMFEEDSVLNGVPGSPPRPETAPVAYPFTSKDTISLSSRGGKAPSDNSSMLVNPDESQSVASHESGEGIKQGDGNRKKDGDGEGIKTDDKDGAKEDGKEAEKMEKKKAASSSRNLWISGLASSTRATDLKAVFSKYGKVIGAKVVTNARTPGARCYGYITMNTSEDAGKCIQHLNRTEIHGRMITVEKAKAETGPAKPAAKVEETRKEESKEVEKKEFQSKRSRDPKKDVLRNGKSNGNAFKYNAQSSSSAKAGVLTFSQIKDQRKEEEEEEEEE